MGVAGVSVIALQKGRKYRGGNRCGSATLNGENTIQRRTYFPSAKQ